MGQNRNSQRADVVGKDEVAVVECCRRLGRSDQLERGSR